MCAEFKDLESIIGHEKLKEKMAELDGIKSADKSGFYCSNDSSALQEGSILKEKYKVLKALKSQKNSNTYIVKDTAIPDKKFVLKEIIPPEMDKNQLKERRDKLQEIIRILSTFRHINLAEVYDGFTECGREYCVMEYVEGLDLYKLMDMSTTAFSQAKVVEWGVKICDALEFLHFRPKPFTLGDFAPDNIMVDLEGELNIINYDLQRFFDPERSLEFMPDNPEELYDDITKTARILYFLLTKERYSDSALALNFPKDTPPKLVKLLETACRSNQRSFGSIKEFSAKLQNSIKEDAKDTQQRVRIFPSIKIDFAAPLRNFKYAFLSQHPFIIALEGILLVFIVFFLVSMNIKPQYHRPHQVPLLYVSAENNIYTFAAEDAPGLNIKAYEEVRNSALFRSMPFTCGSLIIAKPDSIDYLVIPPDWIENARKLKERKSEAQVLLAADHNHSRINVIDIETNLPVGYISTDVNPELIIKKPYSETAYVFHRAGSNITVLNLRNLSIENVFPIGTNTGDILPIKYPYTEPIKERPDTAEPEKEKSLIDALAVSNLKDGAIEIFNSKTGRMIDKINIQGSANSMLWSQQQNSIYALDNKNKKLFKIEIENRRVSEFPLYQREEPINLTLDAEQDTLWIISAAGNWLISFDKKSEAFGNPITIKGQPSSIMYFDKRLWIIDRRLKEVVVLTHNGDIITGIQLKSVPHSMWFLNN